MVFYENNMKNTNCLFYNININEINGEKNILKYFVYRGRRVRIIIRSEVAIVSPMAMRSEFFYCITESDIVRGCYGITEGDAVGCCLII